MQVRPSSMIRAAGAGLAAAGGGRAPGKVRALVLAGSDLAARRVDPVGLQPLAITPTGDLDVLVSVKPDLVTAATGAVSWASLNLATDALLRRLGIPALLRGVVVGAAVYVADVTVSTKVASSATEAESVVAGVA